MKLPSVVTCFTQRVPSWRQTKLQVPSSNRIASGGYLLTVDSPTSFISVKLWFMMIAVHLLSFIYPEKLDSNIFN